MKDSANFEVPFHITDKCSGVDFQREIYQERHDSYPGHLLLLRWQNGTKQNKKIPKDEVLSVESKLM